MTETENQNEESGELVLLFTANGQAVLEEDGEQVWSSDDDDDFRDEIGDEFLQESDAVKVLNYLEEEEIITSDEKPDVIVEVESYTGEGARALANGSSESDDEEGDA